MKTVQDSNSLGATQLHSAEGSTLLTDKDAISERLTEHTISVLNRPSAVSDDAINRLPQKECNVLLDEFPKQRKRFDICLLTKHYAQMQFLLRSIKLVDYQWHGN